MAYNYEYPYTDPHHHNDDWVLKAITEVKEKIESFTAWQESHEAEYKELKKLYDDIVAGRFPEEVKKAFADWMKENALDLVGELVNNVFFEINNDGYFVANIPESWHEIIFNTTGLDITVSGVDFGHLVLSY